MVTQITIPGRYISRWTEVRLHNATDNKGVASMDAEYSADEGNTWTSLGITKSSLYNYTTYYRTDFTWNTEGLNSGTYHIRVKAKDQTGNEGPLDAVWTLDFEVSAVTNLTLTPGEDSITLTWDPVTDPDFSLYTIYRRSASGGSNTYVANISNKSTTSYTNKNLVPATTYYYVVQTEDKYVNSILSEEIAATNLADVTPPTITHCLLITWRCRQLQLRCILKTTQVKPCLATMEYSLMDLIGFS